MSYPRLTRKDRVEIASALGGLYNPPDEWTLYYADLGEWVLGIRKTRPKTEDYEEVEE